MLAGAPLACESDTVVKTCGSSLALYVRSRVMGKSVEELCEEVIAARDKRAALKAELDRVEGALKDIEDQLVARMVEEDCGATRVGGFEFSSTTKVNWKPVAAKRDDLIVALKQGVPELVKETVNAATLASYFRKHEQELEKDQPVWWGAAKACVQRVESAGLSVRKKGKAK